MQTKPPAEKTKLWRIPYLNNIELLHATYVTQNFARHAHDGFPLGVIERGALGFYYRGSQVIAPAGSVAVINPGEPHTGHAVADSGWTYRMFYLDTHMLQQAAAQIADRSRDTPFFQADVIRDDYLAGLLHRLHCLLEQPETPQLEQESRLLLALAQMILRHADDRPGLRDVGQESQAVKRVRDYLEARYPDNISLTDLARIAYLSPFHLTRVFKDEVGIPPHTYLTQVRVKRAKAFLAQGRPIAQAAFETGFVDQSHLTRHFKRIVGVTPGQYRKIVQDH